MIDRQFDCKGRLMSAFVVQVCSAAAAMAAITLSSSPIARASETMQRCSAELLHGEEFAEAAE